MAFNVRVNEKSLRNVEENVKAVIDKVTKNVRMLEEVGTVIITDVKYQTRRGRSIPKDGAPFDALSTKWVQTRQQIAEAQKVSDVFKAGRSNVTLTGELLDSFEIVKIAQGQITIDFEGEHSPYTAKMIRKDGFRQVGKPIQNKTLAKYITENGRPFVGVRLALKQRLNRIVEGFIRRATKVAKLSR